VKYAFIEEQRAHHTVTLLCQVLSVCRSAFYDWLGGAPSQRQQEDERLIEKVKTSHENSRKSYGARRIRDDLRADDEVVSRARVSRLMRQAGVQSTHRDKFKVTTDSDHDLPISPNLLNRDFEPDEPNQVYVSDITYVWTNEGWLYLAVVIDLFSRLVVGWSVSSRMQANLVTAAMNMAIETRKPKAGLIHHSDRGSQYASSAFQGLLESHGFRGSMSRKGNCWDNAVAESFFKTLKSELIYQRRNETRAEVELDIFEYIAVYYNRQRKHSRNDYQSPWNYEQQRLEAA
jgi:putative transposase